MGTSKASGSERSIRSESVWCCELSVIRADEEREQLRVRETDVGERGDYGDRSGEQAGERQVRMNEAVWRDAKRD